MLSSDKNIETLTQLVTDTKELVELRLEYARYEAADKSTRLVAALVLGIVALILVAAIVAFISVTLAFALAPSVGGKAVAFAIVAALYALLLAGIIAFRKRLIERPLAAFFGSLIIDNGKNGTANGNAATEKTNTEP